MIWAKATPLLTSDGSKIALQNGGFCLVRYARVDDEPLLRAMFERCDPADVYLRIFAAMKQFPDIMAQRLAQLDPAREIALVATQATGEGGDIFGVAHLVCGGPGDVTAEFDVMIRSDLKGHGFGYALMSALISEARARGLAEISGYILMENHPMLQMVGELGFKTERIAGGVAEVKLTMNA